MKDEENNANEAEAKAAKRPKSKAKQDENGLEVEQRSHFSMR